MVIGLTGQTGAGKTTISSLLKKYEMTVIDADKVSRNVITKGSRCLAELVMEFSVVILQSDGTLNRKTLASIVFTDKKKLGRLNTIVLPYILEDINTKINDLKKQSIKYILLDAPTLFESGAEKFCDITIAVIADKDIRLHRIIKRDGISQTEAENRINSQHIDIYYEKKSNYVIINSYDISNVKKQIEEILSKIGVISDKREKNDQNDQ